MDPDCAPSPPCIRTIPGFRSFPVKREPTPQAVRMPTTRAATPCTAAFDCRRRMKPLVSKTSAAVLMPGTRPEFCPWNQIYCISRPVQCRKPLEKSFSLFKTRFFSAWSSLLYKFPARLKKLCEKKQRQLAFFRSQ